MHADLAIRDEIKSDLLETILSEVQDYKDEICDSIQNNKSLCEDIEYAIKEPNLFVERLLVKYELKGEITSEFRKYRTSILHKLAAKKMFKMGYGPAEVSHSDRVKYGKLGYKVTYGAMSKEEITKNSKTIGAKGGNKSVKRGVGIHDKDSKKRSTWRKKAWKTRRKNAS